MNRLNRPTAAVALGLSALMLTGCIKYHQKITLMLDGSGKIEYTMAANSALFKQLGQGAGSPLDDFTIGEAADSMEGIVAFSKATEKQANGWDYRSFTAYFEDLNKVKFDKEDPDAPTFTFTKADGKYTVSVSNSPIAKMASDMSEGGGPGDDPAQAAQAKMMFTGFEIIEAYTMPATVTEAPGMTTEGRSAKATLVADDIFDKAKVAEKAKTKQRTLTATGDEVAAADVAAFKAELAKAKAEWEKMKPEIEAAQKAKEAEDGAVEEIEIIE